MSRTGRSILFPLPRLPANHNSSSGMRLGPYARGVAHSLMACVVILLLIRRFSDSNTSSELGATGRNKADPVLVSYSYFEKDAVQRANFEFFIAVGMGLFSAFPTPQDTDFTVVVSGATCTPCKALLPILKQLPAAKLQEGIDAAWTGKRLTLLFRKENEGMDIAAHNTTLMWTAASPKAKRHQKYIFLNSSVRGPFYPSYMPESWQWTQAFTSRINHLSKMVSSSLVCLPEVDAGGPGPRAESWAFATDREGLKIFQEEGVFGTRTCKLCDDGIVVMGEYGLSKALLKRNLRFATLMSRYAPDTDWRHSKHWQCNNQVHPSRSGTYDAITMHPFETIFIKASWNVGEPFTSHYTRWFMRHAIGEAGTEGTFDDEMYRYAVSPLAQEARDKEQCYKPN